MYDYVPVIVHRADVADPAKLQKKREIWEYTIMNGGAIIGAFRNEWEKEIRDLAYLHGAKIIQMDNCKYGEREKPKGKQYEYCKEGKMLIISPEMHFSGRTQRRQECLYMNAFAEDYSGIRM